MTTSEIQETIECLELQGLLRKTGELRRYKFGNLQPVYVSTTVAKWLNETGLIKEFLEYVDTADQDARLKLK